VNKRAKSHANSPIFAAFRDNESILKGFLRRFTSNTHDIDDICQETILRSLEAERSRQIDEPRAFLFGVTRNLVRKRLDREAHSVIEFIADFTPQQYFSNEPSLEDATDEGERMLMFMEAVATLPPQCQRVFVMKKVYGFSHKEIAAELGISISTIEKHVAAGLRRASDYMQQRTEVGDSDAYAQSPSGSARRQT
jgi:RNA polymerase sigma-70 factor (ECF subfamily)